MSVLPSIPRRVTRSRWMEPLVTAVGAAILGFGFSSATAARLSAPAAAPPPPEKSIAHTRTSPTPDIHELIARAAARRVRLALKPPALPPQGHVYHIEWGDTLWTLAQRFHVSLASLEAVNHLTSTNIEAGHYLVIPELYTVKTGDTLASVARQFDVPLVLLWHENRLTQDKLHAGQTIVIPYTGRVPHATYSPPPAPTTTHAAPLANRGGLSMAANLSANDVLLIAHLVQAEAGNQPFLGQVAVAAVVLNRLKTPGFPKTVQGVLFAPGQFETVNNGTFWQAPSSTAVMAARAAVSGWDPSGGALYFYNPSIVHDSWMNTLPETTAIGAQVFAR